MKDPNFNIEEVATAIGMGRTTFYKKLKSLTGLSPVEFVRDMRLKRSRQLLDEGSKTISEIGYLIGFNSLAYFSTCFKEKYKMSPSEYLKGIKKIHSIQKIFQRIFKGYLAWNCFKPPFLSNNRNISSKFENSGSAFPIDLYNQ